MAKLWMQNPDGEWVVMPEVISIEMGPPQEAADWERRIKAVEPEIAKEAKPGEKVVVGKRLA